MELTDIRKMYYQPHRHYHTMEHVNEVKSLLAQIVSNSRFKVENEIIEFFALFHDCVYYPREIDNEERSNELWIKFAESHGIDDYVKSKVSELILLTKHPETVARQDCLERLFMVADWHSMNEPCSLEWLSKYERGIFLENQYCSIEDYVAGRNDFIEKSVGNGLMCPSVANNLKMLVNRKYNIGVYCGSFNPFHVGHYNILRKAEKMFDKVVLARCVNPLKKGIDECVSLVPPNYETVRYECQLVDFIDSMRTEHCNPILVRGLRNGYDLEQESNLISFVNDQAKSRGMDAIPVVYLPCDKEYEHVSSSSIRMLPEKDRAIYLPSF